MMRGRIWVESEVGKGSVFHFTACFAKAAKLIAPDTKLPILVGQQVLVVDDNATNRRILGDTLRNWGMMPTLVQDAESALNELHRAHNAGRPFSLVITDGHMPGMDGLMLTQAIRSESGLANIPIILLTSSGDHQDAASCRRLGLDAYLSKPVRQSELRQAILRVLNAGATLTPAMSQSGKEPDSINPSGNPPGVAPAHAQIGLRVLLAEDNIVNQKLVQRLLEKRGHCTTVVANGREALEALEKESFDLVLMDVQMPKMDGFEATGAIRESEKATGFHQTVIAMTAHAMKGDRERCLSAGMDSYLAKPIRSDELDEVLEGYLERRRERSFS